MALDKLHTAGSGFLESFDSRYPTRVLETLLCDRTTGRNIIWADNEYEALGDGYMGDDEIAVEKITGLSSGVIRPRIAKAQKHQSQRTKTRAEVFTPSWLVNRMNNDIDAIWFGARDAFNAEGGTSWRTSATPIAFPRRKGYGWHAYVESLRLEITCGEAPFVCSRYDTVTGNVIPVGERIGFLDRKLRVVSEKTKSRREWVRWGLAALKASYGYEYQGDNLLLARINVFETFCEHLRERWGAGISDEEMDQVAWIVSWNFWQMNGFTCAVPTNKMDSVVQSAFFGYEEPMPKPLQPTLFGLLDESLFDDETEEEKEEEPNEMVPLCVIYDWQKNEPLEFQAMKGKAYPMDKKFYAVIGNPPYQEEFNGEGNKTYAKPIYNDFMDAAEEVSERVELITPARFLFNAGSTPKAWNAKKLSDPHFTVLQYEADASKVFPNTDIKGGIAITLRDATRKVESLGIFIPFDELSHIYAKVSNVSFEGLDSIVSNRGLYRFSQKVYDEEPDEMKKITDSRILSSSFDRFPRFFTSEKPENQCEYIQIFGISHGKRQYRWLRKDYLSENSNLDKWKVMVPKANGSGALGEVLSTPLIGKPLIGFTETFIAIGEVDTEWEAAAILKYVKTRFARTLLGVLKVTQDNTRPVWRLVPTQDFTSASDIDWSKSISEIDRQLYAKYDLSDEEIDFIESHVKEMD